MSVAKLLRLDERAAKIGRSEAVMGLRDVTRPQAAKFHQMRFERTKRHADLSIAHVGPVLHRVVVGIRTRELVRDLEGRGAGSGDGSPRKRPLRSTGAWGFVYNRPHRAKSLLQRVLIDDAAGVHRQVGAH